MVNALYSVHNYHFSVRSFTFQVPSHQFSAVSTCFKKAIATELRRPNCKAKSDNFQINQSQVKICVDRFEIFEIFDNIYLVYLV